MKMNPDLSSLESKEWCEKILDNIGCSIIIIDKAGRYIYANKPAGLTVGMSPESMIGKAIREILSDDVAQKYIERNLKLIDSCTNVDYEDTFLLQNELKTRFISDTILKDSMGRGIALQSISFDITDRKNDELKIQESEANLKSLVESADSIILLIDSEMRIKVFNKAFYDFVKERYEPNQIIGKHVGDFIPVEYRGQWISAVKRCLKGRKIFKNTSGKSSEFPLIMRFRFNPIRKSDGTISGATIVGHDMTDISKAQKNLLDLNEALRELSRKQETLRELERKEIARDLHDDLGQRLTALNLELMGIRKNIGKNPGSLENMLDKASDSLCEIIEGVKEMTLFLQPVILKELGLIQAVKWHLEKVKKQSEIKLECSIQYENLELDYMLSLSIYRIIQEAITNIMKHSEASKVKFVFRIIESGYEFIIEDNGKGIRKTSLRSATSTGLVGMRERAYSINAKLSIRRNPESGTRVRLVIPNRSVK
jgi:PAS domain S-box-containing protein